MESLLDAYFCLSGPYDLAQWVVGIATGTSAALSTTAVGYAAEWLGFMTALLMILAIVAGAACVYVLALLSKSRPTDAPSG